MSVTQYNYPTTILYGADAVGELATRLGRGPVKRWLLVTDHGIVKAGLAQRVNAAFAANGLSVRTFDGVHPNPIEDDVEAGARLYREEKLEGIVALGGGSPIDAAKAIAMLASHPGTFEDYDALKGGSAKLTSPFPPIHAIPTTAGTGSEVGRSCVIVSRKTGRKIIGFHAGLLPKTAVLDPTFTVGLPPGLTAATGMDAFTHALEAYLSKGFHPIADAVALGALELVIENLPIAVKNGADLEARGRMLMASTMGATAFQKGLGMVHSLAHPLSTHYGAHHGTANALLLEPTFRWQLAEKKSAFTPDLVARYERVTRLFPGFETAAHTALPDAVAAFVKSLSIKDTLASIGLKDKDIASLSAEAFDDPCHPENPIDVTREDLAAVYRRCL